MLSFHPLCFVVFSPSTLTYFFSPQCKGNFPGRSKIFSEILLLLLFRFWLWLTIRNHPLLGNIGIKGGVQNCSICLLKILNSSQSVQKIDKYQSLFMKYCYLRTFKNMLNDQTKIRGKFGLLKQTKKRHTFIPILWLKIKNFSSQSKIVAMLNNKF